MKRFLGHFTVLCAVILCASCAFAGTLSAVYTYDGEEVTKESSKLQIEANRKVQFTYKRNTTETETSYTIAFSDGTSFDMEPSGGDYIYSRTFDSEGEIGIKINSVFAASADINPAMPFELYPAKMKMKPDEQNRFVKFESKTGANILEYKVVPVVTPASMASAAYQTTFNPPRINVSTSGAEDGNVVTLKVTISKSGVEFERVCKITIDKNSTESNMKYFKEGEGGSSGGSGGCSAGFAGLGLLVLLPVIARRKIK